MKTVKDISNYLSPHAVTTAATKLKDCMKHYTEAVEAFGDDCKDDVSAASRKLTLQAKAGALQKQARNASGPQVEPRLDEILLSQLATSSLLSERRYKTVAMERVMINEIHLINWNCPSHQFECMP